MKKIFLLLALALPLLSFSQNFKLGLVAGVNFSQVNGDKLAGFDKIGLLGGAVVSRKIKANKELSFEMLYSEKGSKDVVDINNPIQDTLFRFNYIDIPILYSYYLLPHVKLQMGVYTGVRIKATYDDSNQEYDRIDQIRSMDYGLTGGAEYVYNKHFGFNGRISQSLLDNNNTYDRYYNLYLSFSLRYIL